MEKAREVTKRALLNELTAIKLANQLLERQGGLSPSQRALVRTAVAAVDRLAADLRRADGPLLADGAEPAERAGGSAPRPEVRANWSRPPPSPPWRQEESNPSACSRAMTRGSISASD